MLKLKEKIKNTNTRYFYFYILLRSKFMTIEGCLEIRIQIKSKDIY